MRSDGGLSAEDIVAAMTEGRFSDASDMVADALSSGADKVSLINDVIRPALEELGRLFEMGEIYLPAMVAASKILEQLFEDMPAEEACGSPPIIIGTVTSDIHEIGKNICASMASSKGYRVINLGCDVPPEKFVEAAEKSGSSVIAVSSAMKSSLKFQKEVIELADGMTVFVGGASCSPMWAENIGAAGYSKDCKEFVTLLAKSS